MKIRFSPGHGPLNMKRSLLLTAVAALISVSASQAQVTVYDTVTPNPSAGYGEVNDNNPIFGDALNLSQAGQLQQLQFDLFNTTTGGNSGTINTGTMDIEIYDNTVPYSGGSLVASNPLIGSLNFNLDFTAGGGLPAGFFARITTNDLTSLSIDLPLNIFITQQFTETDGDSISNGTVLSGTNSAVGSSPANVYISSDATPEGLYTFGGGNLNQFAFAVAVIPAAVPEPATWLGASLVGGLMMTRSLRKRRIAR
jgi:hypothetical protein